jgi:hypothetical protein
MARPVGGRILEWADCGPGGVVSTAFGDLDVDRLCDEVDRTATTS